MSNKVKFKVLNNSKYVVDGATSVALIDTTVGKVYSGVRFEVDEAEAVGHHITQPGIRFIDDVGDDAFTYISSDRIEIVEEVV